MTHWYQNSVYIYRVKSALSFRGSGMGIRGAFSRPKLICRRWKVTWSELQKSAPYNTDGIRWQLGQRVLSGAGRQVRERNYKGLSKSRVKGGGNERANGRADICINPSLSLCVLCNDNRLMRVSWCRSLMVRRPAANAVRGGAHSTHNTRLMVHLRRSSTFTNTWCCELRFRPTVFRRRVHFRPFQAELEAVVNK